MIEKIQLRKSFTKMKKLIFQDTALFVKYYKNIYKQNIFSVSE